MRNLKIIFIYNGIERILSQGKSSMCVNEELQSMFNICFLNYGGVKLWK